MIQLLAGMLIPLLWRGNNPDYVTGVSQLMRQEDTKTVCKWKHNGTETAHYTRHYSEDEALVRFHLTI